MLLTVFYIAATWLQSWRVSSIRRKIVQLTSEHNSFVLYKVTRDEEERLQSTSVSSKFCENSQSAQVAELLWETEEIKACSLVPKVCFKIRISLT